MMPVTNIRRLELDAYDDDGAWRHVIRFDDQVVVEKMCAGGYGAFSRALGIPDDLLRVNCDRDAAYATGVLFARAHGLTDVERALTLETIAWDSAFGAARGARLERNLIELDLDEIVLGRFVCNAMAETGFVVPSDMLHQLAAVHEEPGYVERLDAHRVLIAHYSRLRLTHAGVGDYALTAVDLHSGAAYAERMVGGELAYDDKVNFIQAFRNIDV